MKKHDFKVGDVVAVVDPRCILPMRSEVKIIENDNAVYWGEFEGCIEIGYVDNYPHEFILVNRVEKNAVNVNLTINADDEPNSHCSNFSEKVVERMNQTISNLNHPGNLNLPDNMDDNTFEKYRDLLARSHNSKPRGFLAYPGSYLSIPDNAPTIVETNLEDTPNHEPQQLGVYRPNLEDRKVGKVGMHMFIDGFPNAMYEVAKVMTWAADVKGYSLHDWKNLPEAELALSSAGYRHMVDNSVQRADGVAPLDRVDHESELLHLAHQAFNILAQIELIKTGKIK